MTIEEAMQFATDFQAGRTTKLLTEEEAYMVATILAGRERLQRLHTELFGSK